MPVCAVIVLFSCNIDLCSVACHSFGQVADVLVNSAGITRDNFLLKLTEEHWDEVRLSGSSDSPADLLLMRFRFSGFPCSAPESHYVMTGVATVWSEISRLKFQRVNFFL